MIINITKSGTSSGPTVTMCCPSCGHDGTFKGSGEIKDLHVTRCA